jgi:hypothetical protein
MSALDAGIHVFLSCGDKDVDGRDKPGMTTLSSYAALAAAPWACLSIASMICGHIGSGSA